MDGTSRSMKDPFGYVPPPEPANLIGRYAAWANWFDRHAPAFCILLAAFAGTIAIVSYVLSLMP